MRLLLSYSVEDPQPLNPSDNQTEVQEIVLETTLKGVCYRLVRLVPKEPTEVHLSPREIEIARLIAKGLANKTIAHILNISPWTVATHLRRIFSKTDANTRAEMIATLFSLGVLETV
jgi:DNA-binding CsgD family transcriptional regulator